MKGLQGAFVAVALLALLTSCAIPIKAQPSFELKTEMNEAVSLYGPPLSAKQVSDQAEQLVGKTILVDGFLGHYCDRFAKPDCMQIEDRWAIFSVDQLPPVPGPARQPCPMTSTGLGMEILVGGNLPGGFGRPLNRRTVILGTISKRSVTIPLVEAHGSSGTTIDLIQEFVLDKATVLALYDSRCDWLH